jgi:hypothetical protein
MCHRTKAFVWKEYSNLLERKLFRAILHQKILPRRASKNVTVRRCVFKGGHHYALKMYVYEKVRARNFGRAWGYIQERFYSYIFQSSSSTRGIGNSFQTKEKIPFREILSAAYCRAFKSHKAVESTKM